MKRIYCIGKCPICNYGRMELYCTISTGKITAVCEECDVEFDSVSDYKRIANGHRDSNPYGIPLIKPAVLEEIEFSEWYPLVIEE